MEFSFASRPHPAELVCGDLVAVTQGRDALVAAVIDGLGHGPEANKAALAAQQAVLREGPLSPAALLYKCHDAMKATRGAAMSILRLQQGGRGAFPGVGNVALHVRARQPISAISIPGIVGHRMRKVQEFAFAFRPGDLFCLASDGIVSALSLEGVDASRLHAEAERIVASFGRPNDDATALLVVG